MSLRNLLGMKRDPSHYEMTVLGHQITDATDVRTIGDAKLASDAKLVPTKTEVDQPPQPKTCTARMLEFMGLHHPEVSTLKKIVQSMFATLLASDVRTASMDVFTWITDQFINWFPTSDTDSIKNMNAIAPQIVGGILACIAYIYFQRTIGDNLQNTVKDYTHIRELEQALSEHNVIVSIIQNAQELIARYHCGKDDTVDEKHANVQSVQEQGGPLTARLRQSSLSVEAKVSHEPDQKATRTLRERVMSYINPWYFHPTNTHPQIARQISFSLIPSISLTMGAAKTITYLTQLNIRTAAIISAAFIPLPTFSITQKTLAKNTRNSTLYQEHLSHASRFVVYQKQLLNTGGASILGVLESLKASAKTTTASATDAKQSSCELDKLITDLRKALKNEDTSPKPPTKCDKLISNILEKVFYSYPHVPWKKDVTKTIFAAQAGYDLNSAILTIAALGNGHELLAAKLFAGVMAAAGAYSAQASVGTDISNSESHNAFVEAFIAHMKKQRSKLTPLLPAIRYILQNTKIDTSHADYNLQQNLLMKDLARVEDFIRRETLPEASEPTSAANTAAPDAVPDASAAPDTLSEITIVEITPTNHTLRLR